MYLQSAIPRQRYFTQAQVRALDAVALSTGWPGSELMERAGLAAWQLLCRLWPQARRLAIVLGPGNNGGDGWVLARWAHHHGLQVDVQATVEHWTGVAAEVAARAEAAGLRAQGLDPQGLRQADVVVDAVLGSGSRGAPRGAVLAAITAILDCGRPVLALDLPSGVDADRGGLYGQHAVHATATLSFIAAKRGLYTGAAAAHAGAVWVDDLGVELDAEIVAQAAVRDILPPSWPARARDAHKGQHGHVLVLGGNEGMPGAALLCARAAARSGAGWVSLASRPATLAALANRTPEVMGRVISHPDAIIAALQRADVCALGPGLGQDAWAREIFAAVRASGLPCVVDADALRLLAEQPQPWPQAVLTPHPGEAAALLASDTAALQADRFAAVSALHQRYAATVVLKGNGSLVCGPAGMALCRAGNPGMASAGMGDALAGLLAALLAQGLPAQAAAEAAVFIHAHSADRCAQRQGERGLLASDIIEAWQEELNPCNVDLMR